MYLTKLYNPVDVYFRCVSKRKLTFGGSVFGVAVSPKGKAKACVFGCSQTTLQAFTRNQSY